MHPFLSNFANRQTDRQTNKHGQKHVPQLISLKLGVMIGPTNQKNCLSFDDDAVPDTDSESLFHFSHHCGIGDFRRFISISHTVSGRFSRHSAK